MVGAVAVPQRFLGVRDPRPHVADHHTDAPAPVLRHQRDRDLAPLGELDDVAADLGDRGGDERLVGQREAGAGRGLATLLPGRHHVRVPGHLHPHDAVLLGGTPAALEEPVGELGAGRALEEMAVDVQLPLAPPVTAGQRPQHRPAAIGRRHDALGGQEVLHPEAGAGTAQPGRDRAGRGAPLGCHRAGVRAVDLVGHQEVPVVGRQLGQRSADELADPPAATARRRAAPRPRPRPGGGSGCVPGRSARRTTPRRVAP